MGEPEKKEGSEEKPIPKQSRTITLVESPVYFDKPTGNKFWKEILYEGSFANPNDTKKKINFDVSRFQKIVDNFKKNYVDAVYVPLNHSSNPKDNTGFIQDLEIRDSKAHPGKKGLFAKIEIVLNEIAEKIGKTIKGCSVGLEQFVSPKTGELVGEILSHLALTNDQYIPELGEYEAAMFSKEIPILVNFYRFERDESIKPSEEKKVTDAEALALEKKIIELEKKNRESEDALKLSKEAQEKTSKEKVEMEKKVFEGEIANKVDKLVLDKKVKSADRDREVKFTISLGREKGIEYLDEQVAKRDDVIDLTTKSRTGGETKKTKGEATLKASRFNKIFADFMMGMGGHKINQTTLERLDLERACGEWNKFMAEIKDAETLVLENDSDQTIKFTRHINITNL